MMDIHHFLKSGKNLVVELDDEVEYIVDEAAAKELAAGAKKVTLIRVIDRKPCLVSVRRIAWALAKEGPVDYLDK